LSRWIEGAEPSDDVRTVLTRFVPEYRPAEIR